MTELSILEFNLNLRATVIWCNNQTTTQMILCVLFDFFFILVLLDAIFIYKNVFVKFVYGYEKSI